MSGLKNGSAVLGAAGRVMGLATILGVLCALTLYAYASGQPQNLLAQIPSNNSTTSMIGEPSQ